MTKTLKELNGKIYSHHPLKGVLRFDCPVCPEVHEIAVRFGPDTDAWDLTGIAELETITLTPSIRCLIPGCNFHGHVTAGAVDWT